MSIVFKLYSICILLALFLLGILALIVFSFSSLNTGFEQIVQKANCGVKQSTNAQLKFTQANKDMASVSLGMSAIADAITKTNMQVKIVERKMKSASDSLTDFTETVEELYEELEDGDTKDYLEEIADESSDIQESVKREALVGISSTSTSMQMFTEQIVVEMSKIKKLSVELNKGKELSKIINEENASIAALSEEFRGEIQQSRNILLVIIVILVICLVVGTAIFARLLVKPINAAVFGLKDIAEGKGDLTKRLKVKTKDEVGSLARWFNVFIDKLQSIVQHLMQSSQQVDQAAGKLREIVTEVNTNTKDASSRSNNVSMAAEKMSSNMSHIAVAMEEAAGNTQLVTVMTEEISSSMLEVSKHSDKASLISEKAVLQSQKASDSIASLQHRTTAISKVTETITEISEQTNLLALNATIEAARAGKAGKGFSIVANEIKNLAHQTGIANQDIKNQVKEIQTGTIRTVKAIEEISSVIKESNEIVGTISLSVTEESEATIAIAEKISQTSQGINEVNQNVMQSSKSASSITEDIAQVHQAINKISIGSTDARKFTDEMKQLAEDQSRLISQFKV